MLCVFTAAWLSGQAQADSAQIAPSVRIDAVLIDHEANTFSLAELDGAPYILSYVFTGCSSYCPAQVVELDLLRNELDERVGAENYNLVSVSLTPLTDMPADMRAYRKRFSIEAENWRFSTGDPAIVKALIDETGATVIPTADPGDVDHTTQVYLVDSDGFLVSRHDGVPLDSETLKEAMLQLIAP